MRQRRLRSEERPAGDTSRRKFPESPAGRGHELLSWNVMASPVRTALPVVWRVLLAGLVIAAAVLVGLAGAPPAQLAPYAPLQYPFHGARLYVDRDTAAAHWQRATDDRTLDRITRNPQARWLNGPQDLRDVPTVARDARHRDELLVLTVYYIPNRDCAGGQNGAPSAAAYRAFIDSLIRALGGVRAVIIVEPDAVAAECFTPERAALLNWTVNRLATAGEYVYLDAGHSRWRPPAQMAQRLLLAGVARAEGFSVNVANRQTTADSYAYGTDLSRLLGNREFVIDTSRNGLGPPPARPGMPDSSWCNPAREGLGQEPTTATGRAGLAALLWIKPPGESDGACGGQTDTNFSPTLAEKLIRGTRR
jgi:endoglucanase